MFSEFNQKSGKLGQTQKKSAKRFSKVVGGISEI